TRRRRGVLAGLAEVIKTAAIGDAALFAEKKKRLERVVGLEREVVIPVVAACVRYKARVVAEDETEVRGGRGVLNFGHTVGHALEALTGYKELLHGESVAIVTLAAARVAVLAGLLAAGVARADNNPNGIAFRAVGWFKGKGDITLSSIQCDIPTVTNAIGDGVFEQGLWNTYGFDTIYFPDINSPFGNPCGVWLELQNNLLNQAIQVDHIALQYKILGARRFRQFVPARNGFPIACRQLRNDTILIGAV